VKGAQMPGKLLVKKPYEQLRCRRSRAEAVSPLASSHERSFWTQRNSRAAVLAGTL